MKEPEHAIKIVRAVKNAIKIPLTVKMRSGFDAERRNAPEVARMCVEEGAETITIHWRTREDNYAGKRMVDKIAETVDKIDVPVIANGDIIDVPTAVKMFEETGCAGVMVGRGAMRNPWCMRQISQHLRGETPMLIGAKQRKATLLDFLETYHEHFYYEKAALGRFKMITKHFCIDMPDGKNFRKTLLRSQSIDEVMQNVLCYFSRYPVWDDPTPDYDFLPKPPVYI